MLSLVRAAAMLASIASIGACGRMEQSARAKPGDGAVIYQSTILTMDALRPAVDAILVKDGAVADLGAIDDLVQAYPGASFDERFLRRTLLPALVDVRLAPNALNVVEMPCQGGLLPEEITALGAEGGQVRVIAGGPAAFAAAIEAVRRLDAAMIKRVTIEARGPVGADAARELTALGVPLILSGDTMEAGCAPPSAPGGPADALPVETLSGLIALAPARDERSLIGAASRFLQTDSPMRLTPMEALEAITVDAASALGEQAERGVIAPGRRAVVAVIDRNPLATPPEDWGAISVETVELAAPTE